MTRASRLAVFVLAAALLAAPLASAGKPEEQGHGNGNGNGNSGGNNGDPGSNGGGNSGASNGNAGGNGASNGEPQGQGSGQADPPSEEGAAGEPSQGQANGNGQAAAAQEPGASGGNGNGVPGGGSGPAPDASAGGLGNQGSSDPPAGGAPVSDGASDGAAPSNREGQAQGNGPSHSNGRGQEAGPAGQGPDPSGQAGGEGGGAQGGQGPSGGAPSSGQAGGEGGPGDGPAADPPLVTDASSALAIQRGAAGNVLSWSVPVDAGQVQVWRRDSSGWVPVAVVHGADGQATDPEGGATSEYRLTWSSQALGPGGLAIAAKTLPVASPLARGALGQLLALLMWAGVAGVGLVRANVPRRLLESRPGAEHALLPLLAGLPGIDVAVLERVSALGLRTVAQLRAVDADTLAFWARVPAPVVRQWKETLELLVWPALPAGAGERLALAGQTSVAHLASARLDDLLMRLRTQSGVDGPGLPADEAELAGWIAEARIALGLAPTATRARTAEGTVDALRPSTAGVA